jgi:hypothetical protein
VATVQCRTILYCKKKTEKDAILLETCYTEVNLTESTWPPTNLNHRLTDAVQSPAIMTESTWPPTNLDHCLTDAVQSPATSMKTFLFFALETKEASLQCIKKKGKKSTSTNTPQQPGPLTGPIRTGKEGGSGYPIPVAGLSLVHEICISYRVQRRVV